jgi:hypothetical protein
VLQIIPREHDFDCHYRPEGFGKQVRDVPIIRARQGLVARITLRWRNEGLGKRKTDIKNIIALKITDKCVI